MAHARDPCLPPQGSSVEVVPDEEGTFRLLDQSVGATRGDHVPDDPEVALVAPRLSSHHDRAVGREGDRRRLLELEAVPEERHDLAVAAEALVELASGVEAGDPERRHVGVVLVHGPIPGDAGQHDPAVGVPGRRPGPRRTAPRSS